jgi:hypothetical protein
MHVWHWSPSDGTRPKRGEHRASTAERKPRTFLGLAVLNISK